MTAHTEVNEVDTSQEEIDRDLEEAIGRHSITDEPAPFGDQSTPGQTSDLVPAPEFDVKPLLVLPIKVTFDALCPAWGVSDAEIEMMADAYGDLINHYFPDINFGPAGAAIVATGIVIASHAGQPRKLPDPDAESEA